MKKILLFISLLLLIVSVSGQGRFAFPVSQEVSGPLYTDNFESYSEGNLAGQGNWVGVAGFDSINIVNDGGDNKVYATDNVNYNEVHIMYDGALGNDQYAEIELTDIAVNQGIGINLRMSGTGATLNLYYCLYNATAGRIYLAKIVNGSEIAIDNTPWTPTAGDVLKFTAVGTDLTVYVNDVENETLTNTDSDVTSGKAGICGKLSISYATGANSVLGDNWKAGEL